MSSAAKDLQVSEISSTTDKKRNRKKDKGKQKKGNKPSEPQNLNQEDHNDKSPADKNSKSHIAASKGGAGSAETLPVYATNGSKTQKKRFPSAVALAKKERKKAKRKERRENEKKITDEKNIGKPGKNVDKDLLDLPSFLREDPQPRKFVLVNHPSADAKWFEIEKLKKDLSQELQFSIDSDTNADSLTSKTVASFKQYAEKLLNNDTEAFSQKRLKHKPGETNWLKTVSSGGTTADQVAALTLLVQESPLHSLHHLHTLLLKLNKKSRRETEMALDTMKELFVEVLLPPDRKLESFESRPLLGVGSLSIGGNRESRDRKLLLWYFEGQLKHKYRELVVAVEKLCHDSVDATRTKAIRTLVELLTARPEQEQYLLSSVVNKFGDQSYKVAAKVVEYLSKVLQSHPNMKSTMVTEVERLVYRPNISQRAQFYGLCFLSQIMLKASETDLAVQLLNIYFNLFKLLVKKGEIENRMLSQLLAGTNRAFPYAKGHTGQLLAEIDTLYKVVAIAQFGTALQTLLVLFQVLGASEGVSDRFYCALYRKLGDISLHGSSHHPLLFNLLYKTLKADAVSGRVKAFLKRALQLGLNESPAFACGALLLVSELRKSKPDVLRTEKTKELLFGPSTSLGEDVSHVKMELDDDEDDEHFVDVHGPESDTDEKKPLDLSAEEDVKLSSEKKKKSSWVHRENQGLGGQMTDYDPFHRNPLFACADMTLEYELHALARHYHPSVQVFAQTILNGETIDYGGDPLQDFTMMRFMDRFVYRKPKTDMGNMKKNPEDSTTSDPATTKQNWQRKNNTAIRRKAYDPWGVKKLAVGSEEYAMKKEEDIPADERFLHRFVTTVGRPKNTSSKKRDDSDAESVNSDEFESLLEKFEPGGDNEEFDVDFGKELSSVRKPKTKKRRKTEESDESESDDMGGGLEEDSPEEEEEDGFLPESEKKKERKKRKRMKEEDLFASAERFAEILEEKGEPDKEQFKKKPRPAKFGPKYRGKKKNHS